ncbi:MAG: polysaccharide deacetylase family protein [Vulcanibacillus sp.]
MAKTKYILIILLTIYFLSSTLAFSTGAEAPTYYEDKVAVLMYHHIDPTFKSSATIPPELFEEQINYLVSKGYNFISMSQFEDYLYKNAEIPKNSVLITFDDGYRSYFEYAYPVLKEYNISSTNFVIGEWIDKESGLSRLTSSDMIELANDSIVDLQSHSYLLHKKTAELKPYLTTNISIGGVYETQVEYYNRIKSDLEKNKNDIEAVTTDKVYSFAYPYGAYNISSINALKETGHTLAFTINKGIINRKSNPYLLNRINAGNPDITPQDLHETILSLNSEFVFTKNQMIQASPEIYLFNQLIQFPEQKPFIRDGITYVPVRAIGEELGAKVNWDSRTGAVVVTTLSNEVFELQRNNKFIKKDGHEILLEAAPIVEYGSFFVPVRSIETMFGAFIEWNEINKTINIYL